MPAPPRDANATAVACFCTLPKPFASRTWLWVMASVASDMLETFLTHHVALGVLHSHITVVLHVPNATIMSHGAHESSLEVLRRHRVDQVHMTARWSAVIKAELIAAHAARLPPHAWLLWADVDELIRLPCDLTFGPVCADMVERLPSRVLAPPTDVSEADTALTGGFAQVTIAGYPTCARMRYFAAIAANRSYSNAMRSSTKTVLFPVSWKGVRVQMPSSHSISYPRVRGGGPFMTCAASRGVVEHFADTPAQNHLRLIKLATYATDLTPAGGSRQLTPNEQRVARANRERVQTYTEQLAARRDTGYFSQLRAQAAVACPSDCVPSGGRPADGSREEQLMMRSRLTADAQRFWEHPAESR